MNEQTPSTPEKPPLRENRDGWPWGQLFILTCCLYLCSIGLADALAAAGFGAHELIRSLWEGLLIAVLILAVLAGHHSSRLREQGERLRRIPQLRLANTGVFSLGILLFILAMIVPAVNKARESAKRFEQQQATGTTVSEQNQTIRTPDGQSAIDLPAHWQAAPDYDPGAYGVARADIANDLYVAMWSEPRADVAAASLDDYAGRITKLLEGEYQEFEVLERTNSTITGHPTIEIVIRVVIENSRLMIAIRFVELPDHFVQVRVWALPSRFLKHEATLRKILRSVHSE